MIWSFYDRVTGVFTGQTLMGPKLVKENIPEGLEAFEGEVDHRTQRLDILTGALVSHAPEEENPIIQQSRSLSVAMAEIESLERLQIRSMSDLFDNPGDQDARANYDRRKARIAELRAEVTAGRETIARAGRNPSSRETR